MKLGYSILLGETLGASAIDYHDCERWQVVCPNCREPVFKGARPRDDSVTHYLSHYAAKEAYAGDCELRVGKLQERDFASANATAREQRLAYFLSVLRRTLSLAPIYKESSDKTHWKLNAAPAITRLKESVWSICIGQDREEIFDTGADDYLWKLTRDGWGTNTTFSIEQQKRIARDMWLTLTTSVSRSNWEYLFNHAWVNELISTITAVETSDGMDRTVSSAMVRAMNSLLAAKKSEVPELLHSLASTELPHGYNKVRGSEDDEPSTFITRLTGRIVTEMVGVLVTLPYFEILKQQFGDPSKVYPYQQGIVPVSEEELARRDAWNANHPRRDGMH